MKVKKLFFIILPLFFSLFFSYIYLFYPYGYYNTFDNKIRDIMFRIRGEIPTTNNIVIVDIDEKSLLTLGQWPWSRDKIADILYNLTDAGALMIGLDIFFAERDSHSSILWAKKFQCQKTIDYDDSLAKALENTPTLLGYFFSFDKNFTKNSLPDIPAIFIEKDLSNEFLLSPKGYISNIDKLTSSAYSAGFVNMIPDDDGVVRAVPLLMKYDDSIYPSLAFEMFRIALQASKVVINYSPAGVSSIDLNGYDIKTDRFGRLFINYRGPKGVFKYISAVDILEGNFNQKDIQDKFILIGTSAGGLFDLRVTPFDTAYPGVEIHANLLDNLIKGDFLYKPDFIELIDIGFIFLTAFIVTIIFLMFEAIVSVIVLSIFIVLYFVLVYYLMFSEGYILGMVLPIFETILLSIILIAFNYFLEIKNTIKLRKTLSKKVSQDVMQELVHNNTDEILSPRSKEVTTFFSDIRDFTSISEKLNDPQKVINLLNFYMTPMVDIITHYQGTIDKFIGDAIMAYWNAPNDTENHADKALQSSLKQIDKLKVLNEYIYSEYGINIDIGIGINTGIVTIGEMGSKGRADYTIIGDNVNLASRLEGLNKIYKTHILITEFTKNLLVKDYVIREVDLVRVKGKNKPVKIFEVISFGKASYEFRREYDKYYEALLLYRDSEFELAKDMFEELYEKHKLYLYKLYIDRCEIYIKNPPQNFDGVFTFTTK